MTVVILGSMKIVLTSLEVCLKITRAGNVTNVSEKNNINVLGNLKIQYTFRFWDALICNREKKVSRFFSNTQTSTMFYVLCM